MKSNAFLFGIVVINVVLLHFLLVILEFINGDVKTATMIEVLLVILSLPGFLLINGIKKDNEKFTGKFLITTVIQMLGFLSIALAMVYSKIDDYKMWVMSFLVLFLIISISQTIFLLRALKVHSGK